MAYSLRLPDALDAAARERSDYLGISLNALLCVALDAYLRAPAPAAPHAEAAAPDGLKVAAGEVRTVPTVNPVGLTKAERRELTQQQRLARKAGR